jgi:FkbM family methyltransferase
VRIRRRRDEATTAAAGFGARATRADVVACYRLLLGRAPDEAGLRTWLAAVDAGVTVGQLVDQFLASSERLARRAPAPEPALVTAGGVRLYALPGDLLYGAHFLAHGEYEPHVCAVLDRILTAGAVFVDVGANMGVFSLRAAARVGPAGHVHAVEASTRNAALLARSIAENGFANVTLHHVAASDRTGELAVLENPLDTNARVALAAGAGERTRAVRLDDLLGPALRRLDVVKVDVEGFEVAAIEGFRATLERLRPPLVVEVNPTTLELAGHDDPAVLPRLLESLGYAARPIDRGTREPGPAVGADALVERIRAAGETHADVLFEPARRAG